MARQKKTQRKPDYRIVTVFAVLGALAFGFGAWGALNGVRTLKWPRAEAQIVDAKLSLHERETRDVQRPDKWHTFAVHYMYRVGDKTYLGGGIEPYDFNMQNSAGAVTMADKFPAGAKAPVAYDPNNPADAYLMPGPSSFSLVLTGLGVVFFLVALLARRMIRVGPGEDDANESKPVAPKKPVALDPEIGDYYRKPGSAEP